MAPTMAFFSSLPLKHANVTQLGVILGGYTGGLTRAVLYNWTPPNIDDEFQ